MWYIRPVQSDHRGHHGVAKGVHIGRSRAWGFLQRAIGRRILNLIVRLCPMGNGKSQVRTWNLIARRMRGRQASQTSGWEGTTAHLYRVSHVFRPPCRCINAGQGAVDKGEQGACGQGGAGCVTGDSSCAPLAACERCRFIRESAAYKDDSGAWFAYLSLLCGRRAVAFPQGSWALLMLPMSCRCAAATTGSYGIGGGLTSYRHGT